MYSSDLDGTSDKVALDSYEWAVENGEKYRIAYCCHSGDFDVPSDWSCHIEGIRGKKQNKDKMDMVMFSQRCVGEMDFFSEE